MYKLDLKKIEDPEIKLTTFIASQKKVKEIPEKKVYFSFIDYTKALDCVDHNRLWKSLKEMGLPDNLLASW